MGLIFILVCTKNFCTVSCREDLCCRPPELFLQLPCRSTNRDVLGQAIIQQCLSTDMTKAKSSLDTTHVRQPWWFLVAKIDEDSNTNQSSYTDNDANSDDCSLSV